LLPNRFNSILICLSKFTPYYVVKNKLATRHNGAHNKIKQDEEELDNVLDYYLQRTYWSIYSRETKDAVIVVELVKQYIEEMESPAL